MQPKLVIVHGYQAKPESHWFNWLCQQFPNMQHHVLALPNSHAPEPHAWQHALEKQLPVLDENTYVVAHSLGCITTLRYLASQPEALRLGGLLLVAGFAHTLPNLPQLDVFNQDVLPWHKLQQQIPNRQVFLSLDDDVVAPEATEQLSQSLKAPLLRLSNRGHFTQADGCHTLPEAVAWLQALVNV